MLGMLGMIALPLAIFNMPQVISFPCQWQWLPCTSRSVCNSLTILFRAHQAPQRFGPRGQEPYTWLVIKPETECCPNNISSSAQFINFINLKIHCHFLWWKASMLREALWLAKHREGWTTSPCFPPYRSPKTVREGGLLEVQGKKKQVPQLKIKKSIVGLGLVHPSALDRKRSLLRIHFGKRLVCW